VGDLLIIATFASYSEEERLTHQPIALFVDENNQETERKIGSTPVQKSS
jgi:aspartate 1-decarboxylase